MSKYVALGLAGALGTISRYLLGGWVYQWLGAEFPYGTLAVNVTGCLVIGFLGTLADERSLLNPQIRLAALLGFLGAFTTYSSFAYETWNLFKDGELFRAGGNLLATFVGCFSGLVLGVFAARIL